MGGLFGEWIGRVAPQLSSAPRNQAAAEVLHRYSEPNNWQASEIAERLLLALNKRGLPVVITSNWGGGLAEICAAFCWTPLLAGIVSSSDVRTAKPARAIFLHAAAIAKVSPMRMLHVGDDYACDLLGARRAGMQAILVSPRGMSGSMGREDLEDILCILGS